MKILIIYDVDGWAWHRNSIEIQKYLTQYDITITKNKSITPEIMNQFNHVHYFGWLEGRSNANKVSAGVTSYNFIRSKSAFTYQTDWPKFKALTANNKSLYEIVKQYNKNVFLTPNGVDENKFYPVKKKKGENLVVGWVGQNNGASFLKHEDGGQIDIKGFNLILKPLMKSLEGKGVEFKINNSTYKEANSHESMPEFFNSVDVQICTSYREGTPNPMFEASACGRALISTKVGAIQDCIVDGQNGFLINEYSKESDIQRTIDLFREKLIFLRDNRDICEEMGQKGREIIERDWTWKKMTQNWVPVFEKFRKR